MGCGASKEAAAPAPGSVAFAAAKPLAPMTPTAQAAAEARTVRLLESLAAKKKRVKRPVLPNSERRRSGQRGMTRALLFGVILGAAHQYTVKWQRVLEGVSADS